MCNSLNYFNLKPVALSIKVILFAAISSSSIVYGDEIPDAIDDLEVITITNQRHLGIENSKGFAQGHTSVPDLASWLTSVPGANINSNGPITGIAQYRGLYGDRVATSLDGHPVIGAGPNTMDTPLSYSTPLIVDSMTVYRGIAPVSAGINTLGGAIEVKMRKAESMNNDTLQLNGDVQAGYRSNNSAKTLSAVTNIAKGDVALLLYGNSQTGDSMESGDGIVISPTDFDKVQLGGDIRYSKDENEIGLSYHYTDTNDSGTPALPMDIEYIESHRLTLDGTFELANWHGEWKIGYVDADHGMTNHFMRDNTNLVLFRRNNATAETTDFSFELNKTLSFGELAFGVDGYFAVHDSVITNENNAMFEVVNFNDVEDNRYGIFTEWQNKFAETTVQLGIRLKRAKADANEVRTSMAMMNPMMKMLQDKFNNADRTVLDNNVDIALSTETKLSESTSLYAGVGIKSRAPSYQERYLWMPMESTGGLADGNTYIGNINLKSETAQQVDLGLTYQTKDLMVAPHIFYQSIDDYIQGTPIMLGMQQQLKFTNVDAKLYGADVNGYYHVSEQITLSMIVSYVQGERRDINDNLYRIAPLNGKINLTYSVNDWALNATVVMATKQDKISTTNSEQESAGYGVVNIDGQWYFDNDLTLRLGIDNIFDKNYQNPLGGYNRVKGTEIAVMSRLPSEGVSAWAEMTYSF